MKRIIACLLAAVLLWALFAFHVSAEKEKTESKYLPLDIFSEDIWEGTEGTERISKRSAQGSPIMAFTSEKGAEKISVTASFEPIDLSEYNEIVFEMQARGGAEKYPVTVTGKKNRINIYELNNMFPPATFYFIPTFQDMVSNCPLSTLLYFIYSVSLHILCRRKSCFFLEKAGKVILV